MNSLRLGTRLALFNLMSKIVFTILFISFLPLIVSRISLIQTDNELVNKREKVIGIISDIGIEPFMTDSINVFGSYNILKEEFVSLEKENHPEESNFIEIARREIDNEIIEYRVLNYSFNVDDETYLLQIGKSLDSITQTQLNIRRIILIFLIFIILITLISDLFYTERLLRPLRVIVNKLKHTSNLSAFDSNPVKTNTSDFIRLDRAMVELMNRINDLISKEREITANMSHELLTPVSVIRGQLENILSKSDADSEIIERVEGSLRTLHRLKTLINSLLFFSRIESQQYLKEDTFEMSDLIGDINGELAPIATDKGVDLTIECNDKFVVENANKSLMFSMVYNVVNNAIQHTGEGGQVILKCFSGDQGKGVSIADTGKGISPEQMKNLFTRFRKKFIPGSESNGIGLAITKSIADFHGIEVKVESSPEKGTRFFFRFPENS